MRPTMRSIWLDRTALLVLFSAVCVPAVSAQAPQPGSNNLETALIQGRTVWITDAGGREEETRIIGVSAGIVTANTGVDIRRFRTTDIVRVRARHSDSVLNGALIGAGAAVASGLFLCTRTEPWENCRDDIGPMVKIGALGAGIGIAIDALIRGRRTIYEAPATTRLHLAPIRGRHRRGLQIAVSF